MTVAVILLMLRICVGALFLAACAFENAADVEEDVVDDSDPNNPQPSPLAKCNAVDKTGMALCVDFEDTAPAGSKPVFTEFFGATITQQLNIDPMSRTPEQAAHFFATSVFAIEETQRLDVANVTMEMWTRPARDPGGQAEQGLFENSLQYKMVWEGGRKIECQIGASATDRVDTGVELALNQWAHVACTFDGDELRVYVNGNLEGCNRQVAAVTTPTFGNLGSAVGASIVTQGTQPAYVNRFDGQIDNVRVYSRKLEAADICKIATGSTAGCDDTCPSYNGGGWPGGEDG